MEIIFSEQVGGGDRSTSDWGEDQFRMRCTGDMPEINKSDARCKASRYRPITIPSGYSDEAYGQDRIVSRGNVFYKLSELTYAIAKADRKCGKPVRNDECIHDRYVR